MEGDQIIDVHLVKKFSKNFEITVIVGTGT